ncbi:MAG: hypothetical protein ACE3JQ_00195 [Paenisporosarcina sp.]
MPEETNGLLSITEQLNKLNQAMFEDDGKFELLKKQVSEIGMQTKWQGKEIKDIKDDLKTILDNTTWLKRAILTAIIGTLTTGILGGAIALIWNLANKGVGG